MYTYNTITKIWLDPQKKLLVYNDGDEAENRIARAIHDTQDVSALSQTLAMHCTDWSSVYHLSPDRANVLRPFAHLLRGKTLEIGSGCGAITRYLAELGGDVTAIEGSLRRATITASRTRDLTNVKVICENFQDFHSDELFDAVTLIGVLEYAQMYITDSSNPVLHVLQLARKCLKQDGVLIIAIENQLGLKYFAGIPEDHVGKSFYNIQDDYNNNGPITFGRKELESLIQSAGFPSVECATPFPDYKLPDCVILPEGLADPNFDKTALVGTSILKDRQIYCPPLFSLPNACDVIARNGLLADLANSLIMIASVNGTPACLPDTLAYHFSINNRHSTFCKQTTFARTSQGSILAIRTKLDMSTSLPKKLSDNFTFNPAATESYQQGYLFAKKFSRIVTTSGWNMAQIGTFIKEYIAAIRTIETTNLIPAKISVFTKIPGYLIDALPSNLIVTQEEKFVLIDQEWSANTKIDLGLLIFRSLECLLNIVRFVAEPKNSNWLTKKVFFIEAFAQANLKISEKDLQYFFDNEMIFQSFVTKNTVSKNFQEWANLCLETYEHHPLSVTNNKLACKIPKHDAITNSFRCALKNTFFLLNKAIRRKLRRASTQYRNKKAYFSKNF